MADSAPGVGEDFKALRMGGSVKRSLAVALLRCGTTIANAYGLDDATPRQSPLLCRVPLSLRE